MLHHCFTWLAIEFLRSKITKDFLPRLVFLAFFIVTFYRCIAFPFGVNQGTTMEEKSNKVKIACSQYTWV